MALEKQWGRFKLSHAIAAGHYATTNSGPPNSEATAWEGEVASTLKITTEFAQRHGRRPSILVAKMGQDGHDRGANVIASSFADVGFDVVVGPLFATPEEVAEHAIASGVHVVGVSSMAAGHRHLLPDLVQMLRGRRSAAMVVAGGVIPAHDHAMLHKSGIAAIYGPGTRIPAAARAIVYDIDVRLREQVAAKDGGHEKERAAKAKVPDQGALPEVLG